ncbi:tRNA (guanine-N(1)-)-methyltransferase [Candidatus Kinetoplastibacterium sorsogonicusi]|uniref:tRNA (guanine-N(1)-)-methyltransferase n=1 Tax=Candidatus Kinetoplastidibacterium kentomonadis TaxID=1576550 RepID=A0A3S7JA01_9PROT|nr:tRNA (guanosine(37)-N1)-methyltransferase TrmD [Candidatus Kinetoplastibacterium sorsogonicusi]AWD32498.1 tRNA (guanine-N(1)-)-methyltransferase [Candidatus Kinetoplastibacterium sorsogonicusi]
MRIDVISIFPEIFDSIKSYGITAKALNKSLWMLNIWNPRLFAKYPNYRVDDRPYGGGPGMVMLAEPLEKTIEAIKKDRLCYEKKIDIPIIYLTPAGKTFNNTIANDLSTKDGLIIICGRYEGIDQRLIDKYVNLELSIGDFILSGGEIAAIAIIDSIIRFLPGVLNDKESALQDSFGAKISGLLDTPHYTRPRIYNGINVPDILLNGNHKDISQWRKMQSIKITKKRRPDLLLKK